MLHFTYYSTNIRTEYFKHAAHSVFFSSKCRLFHNATFFGSCIIHILYTGCAKIKKKFQRQRVKQDLLLVTCNSSEKYCFVLLSCICLLFQCYMLQHHLADCWLLITWNASCLLWSSICIDWNSPSINWFTRRSTKRHLLIKTNLQTFQCFWFSIIFLLLAFNKR